MTGEFVAGQGCAAGEAILAPGEVAGFAAFRCAVDGVGGAAQVVAQQPVERTGVAHGDALVAGIVILLDRCTLHLVPVAHIDRRYPADGAFDARPIAVIDEAGRGRTANAGQPVLGVVALGVAAVQRAGARNVPLAFYH